MNKYKILGISVFSVLAILFLNFPVLADEISDGINYLKSQQQSNGQIAGFTGVSAWAAMSFVANGIDPESVTNNGVSLKLYLQSNPPSPDGSATDWERNLLAVTSMSQDPTNFGGINYLAKTESFYNNFQLGSTTLVNDDIFGILALVSSGEDASSEIKEDVLKFIISKQRADGGFSWSINETVSDIDTTSAAIQALNSAKSHGLNALGLNSALNDAVEYLISVQNTDGGFPYSQGDTSNGSTTAWALMALNSIGETGESAQKAKEFLKASQEENGSFKWQSTTPGETFTTSYAVIALAGEYFPVNNFEAPSVSPLPSVNPSPSVVPSPSIAPSPSVTPSVVPSVSPSVSPSIVPSLSPNPSASASANPQGSLNQRLAQFRERQKKLIENLKSKFSLFQFTFEF